MTITALLLGAMVSGWAGAFIGRRQGRTATGIAVCVLLGPVGIALLLRRALGATPSVLVAQMLLEGAVLGALGGAIASVIGPWVLVGTAMLNRWTPVLDLRFALVLAPLGAAVGAVAAVVPARRAARLDPATALR